MKSHTNKHIRKYHNMRSTTKRPTRKNSCKGKVLSRSQKYHTKMKRKKAVKLAKPTEVHQLYDSSAQESKYSKRLGSTLVMATPGTFINMGDALITVLLDNKKIKKDLRGVKFLDIGGGLCTGMTTLKVFHKTFNVSIEASPRTYGGSLHHLETFIQKVSTIKYFNNTSVFSIYYTK